ncbi:vacuolar protein sorting-associated protein 11 homolog [Latimeria chalumnae]|uniref:Vacuolar protein sorting-associated protein 11 homolog n=1 Tax=Latimeria chalumnae TaxID=7897 RepID=H3BDT5_LATCH|nr:PREDICTED: vacuolar protein sorting-associated protein 11 homolog [Latimeria chalumnae]|eukprot:XP_005988193.1 PREDICTED: vacuolar protein sorting-associated protein 11 homolog [Latimeria chalumnae]
MHPQPNCFSVQKGAMRNPFQRTAIPPPRAPGFSHQLMRLFPEAVLVEKAGLSPDAVHMTRAPKPGKMAAYQQWRRFIFFDRETVKEACEQAEGAFSLPAELSVCDSGRGSLVLGDLQGHIWFLNRSLQLSSFQGYKQRVTHLYQLKQHSILVSVGEDENGTNPLVKVWNLDKRDGGNPLCTRIFTAIPEKKPTEVSCLAVHENLNYMAIGFEDGSIVLTKGDITRDRHSKTQTLHEGNCPITGLAFRQSGKTTHLFVVTMEKVQSYNLSVKDYPRIELDTHGCSLRCSALTDPSQDMQFIVAGDECVYLYQPDERGPCFAFEGHKLFVHWYRGYLVIVSKEKRPSPKSEFSGQTLEKQILTIYDLENKFIAYSAVFDDIIDVLSEWGSLYILTRDRKLSVLQEKDTQTKLEMLFKKNLFVMAINLAKSQHLDADGLSEIFRQYGDHLYLKGDHDGAIQQYIRTIGKLEPSYVIRKFLDAQRIHNLTAYLQALHRQSLANADHTTLLLNCYTKLKDSSKLEEFIKTSESEVHFDVETAIKVLRQAGYYTHAVYLAEKHFHHEWYLKIQLEDIKNYQEALHYIGTLPFDQAESNMKRYGKTLMLHVPEETTKLLKSLCTDYKPSGEVTAEKESLGWTEGRRLLQVNSEEFIPIFANNPRELKAFLEHMIEVQPDSPQGVYDTLLELRLQDWAHAQDSETKKKLQEDAISLLKSGNFKTVFDKALVLCQMHNFKDGVLYLYEQGQLYQQIMHYHMQNEQYGKVIEACEHYGDKETCLWEQALSYFARKEEDCKEHITAVLKHIERNNLMPPLLVVQTLAHNSTATLSVIKDYLISKLQQQSDQIAQDEWKVHKYREETAKIRQEIEELKHSAKIFQKTKCSMCNSPLELPSIHFLCGHSFHQHCFESYAENDAECLTCLAENRKVKDMIQTQEQKRDLHDQFQHQLKCSHDGFSVIADYFGRGVFNKLTLITDLPSGKPSTANIDTGLQRDLLIHTKRNT